MNQVGDIVIFTGPGTLPGSATPIYVWKFWDASVAVSHLNQGTISKRLNAGGNPTETALAQPFTLPYRCDICNDHGTVVSTLNRSIDVNNPPSIYGNPTVNPDNQLLPFQTSIRVQAYDMENTAVKFYWYNGALPLGGQDTTTGPVLVAGTYAGTLIGADRNSYTNVFTPTVTDVDTTFTCKIVDADSGTNLLHVPVQGYDPSSPLASVAAQPEGLTVDASTLPDVIIAPGQNVLFTAYGYDSTPGILRFTWYLYGTNGWNQPGIPIISIGASTALQRGYRNDFTVSIASEHTTGLRTAELKVLNQSTQKFIDSEITVRLIQNSLPEVDSVKMYGATGNTELTSITKAVLPARTIVRFSGTATDANEDAIYFKWSWTTPGIPANYILYGKEVYIDATTWPANVYSALGFVTVYDKYGAASSPFPIPQVTVNP